MYEIRLDAKSMVVGWAVLILLWCVTSYALGVPRYLLSPPDGVTLYVWANGLKILKAVGISGSQAAAGCAFAVILGIGIGATIYYIPFGRRVMLPPLVAVQTTPVIALAPLVSLWFGYGWFAKTVVATVIAVFPIVVATYSGLGQAKRSHVHLFKLSGVGELTIFWRLHLRSAALAVLPAIKVAAIFAVIGSIVADFMGGQGGLGFLIMKATYTLQSDMLMTAVVCSALLGQVLLITVERIVSPWEKRLAG